MLYVIFHGSYGSADSHWFPDLKKNLELHGQQVYIPQFPVENWDEVTKMGPNQIPVNQSLASWFKVFEEVKAKLSINDKWCFVGHSLGPLFILHLADKYNMMLDSAIFVAPFLRKLNKYWQIDKVNETFYKTNFNFNKLRRLIPLSYVIYSDNDPYVDREYSEEFARKLNSKTILISQGRHFNSEAGWIKFPLVLDLCKKKLSNISK